jgi:hypothetical protein
MNRGLASWLTLLRSTDDRSFVGRISSRVREEPDPW